MNKLQTLLNEIEIKRQQEGISSRERYANMLGITNGALSNWRLGKRSPNLEVIRKLAKYYSNDRGMLETIIDYALFGGNGNETS